MIRNKKATSKLVSVLSAIIAAVMLVTTVFASGVLSDFATDDYTIEITNNGEKIELINKPFIENGEVYLPLREMFEKVGVMNNESSYINWDNGKITIFLGYDYTIMDDRFELEIGKNHLIYKPSHELPNSLATRELESVPVLRNGTTYIPYSYIRYILDISKWNISYIIYDKNGNLIYLDSFYHQVLGEYSIKIPVRWSGKYTVKSSDNTISFVQKATYEKYGGGTLFSIEKVSADRAEEILNMLGGSRLLDRNDEYAYIFEVPTDVQHSIWVDRDEEDIAIASEYEEMFADIDFIANSFVLANAQ